MCYESSDLRFLTPEIRSRQSNANADFEKQPSIHHASHDEDDLDDQEYFENAKRQPDEDNADDEEYFEQCQTSSSPSLSHIPRPPTFLLASCEV
jgi:hypothetical protein